MEHPRDAAKGACSLHKSSVSKKNWGSFHDPYSYLLTKGPHQYLHRGSEDQSRSDTLSPYRRNLTVKPAITTDLYKRDRQEKQHE